MSKPGCFGFFRSPPLGSAIIIGVSCLVATNKQRKSLHLPPASPTHCLYLIQRRPKVLTSLVFNTANVYPLRVLDLHWSQLPCCHKQTTKVPPSTPSIANPLLVFNTANVYSLRVSDLHRPRCLYLIQRRPKVPTVTSLGFSACLALKRSACSVANSCFTFPQPFVSKVFFSMGM
jgi:hypothetical protein